MKTNCILVRFGEIWLKGKNRPFFEKKLMDNIRHALERNKADFRKISRIQGRLVMLTEDPKAVDALRHVFGIVSYSPALMVGMDIENVKRVSLEILKERKPGNFRVSARRLDKNLGLTSQRANEIIGEYLAKKTKIPVRLNESDMDIGIDMTPGNAYIFTQVFRGLGGLPVGVSGRVLCFISGGIDSPVAAWLAMKRGCEVILVHFLHGMDTRPSKIVRLCEVLGKYQPNLKLLVVPAEEMEKEIIRWVPARYRIIVLRRMFLIAAERLMEKENALAIVTGDNIGQVASQTLHNMRVIDQATRSLILRPLLGHDKTEIVDMAARIGTYRISIEPYADCCTFMLPKHPETKARLQEILDIEKNIDMDLAGKAVEKASTISS